MSENERVASPVGEMLKVVASKTLEESLAMQEGTPQAMCFPTDSPGIVFNGKKYGDDLTAWQKNGEIVFGPFAWFMFDYQKRNPLNYSAGVQRISMDS